MFIGLPLYFPVVLPLETGGTPDFSREIRGSGHEEGRESAVFLERRAIPRREPGVAVKRSEVEVKRRGGVERGQRRGHPRVQP